MSTASCSRSWSPRPSTAISSSPANGAGGPPRPPAWTASPPSSASWTRPAQLEIALVENLQREDLDPIEAAHGFRRLIDEFGLSAEQVATRVGKARSTVANTLRLLDLATVVQQAVIDRSISEGHARALGGLSVEHQEHVVGSVIDQDLSVRQTEELVRRIRVPRVLAAPSADQEPARDPDLDRVEEDLRQALGTKVSLARTRRGGRIVIEYYSDEELGRLYDRLTGGTA